MASLATLCSLSSKDVETHLQKLQELLNRLNLVGLSLKLTKYNFMKKQIAFLGHVLDAEGIHTTSEKVTVVQNFPASKDLKPLRSFLDLSGYYRNFVPNYSTIASPLNQLLRKDSQFLWGTEQETAFNQLKSVLTTAPTLACPNFQKDFHLYTDASGVGLGTALMQLESRNRLQPLAYSSRTLNQA